MSDSRSRFEAWIKSEAKARAAFRLDPAYVWQAAEAEAARRCAKVAERLATMYRDIYKGRAGERELWHTHHTDGMCDGAGNVEEAIKAEFPEAFK